MGLRQERERIYLDMKGRVAPDLRKFIAKSTGDDIIESGAINGALTDKNDPLYTRRDAHANRYYDSSDDILNNSFFEFNIIGRNLVCHSIFIFIFHFTPSPDFALEDCFLPDRLFHHTILLYIPLAA